MSRHHTHHKHRHVAHRHHHVTHKHSHHHKVRHHHARHHANPVAQAFNFIGKEVVKPVWHDIVKPIVALPSEALHTVDHTVSVLDNPIVPIAVGGVALALFLRR